MFQSQPHKQNVRKSFSQLFGLAIFVTSQIVIAPKAIADPLPDLTIAKSHTGNFSAGGIGLYTFTVSNIGAAPSSGSIVVTDTLPAGLSVNAGNAGPVATSGTNAANWTCNSNGASPQAIVCQNSAIIAATPGSNTSTFQVYVNLSTTTASSITNTATVSGGGESNTTNNTATDPTTVTSVPNFTCGTMYGVFGSAANALRVYDPTGPSVGGTLATLTGQVVTLGVAPFLDSNGRRRLYYIDGSGSATTKPLYYYDGVSQVATGISVPDNPNRMGFSLDGVLYMSAKSSSGSQVFYRYDPATNDLTGPIAIADNPNNAVTIASSGGSGDLAFDASGVMYLVTGNSGNPATEFRLYRIDGATGSSPMATLLDTAPTDSTTTSLAFAPNGQMYLISNGGRNWQWNLATGNVTELTSLGSTNAGFDLGSCTYPSLLPSIIANKTVAKISGSSGTSVTAGDTLEYTITVRNIGSLISAGTTLQDDIPVGTSYVANSTTLNGTALPDNAGVMPFVTSKKINGPGQVSGSIVSDTTPTITTDNEAVIKFKVKVNSGNLPANISNRANVSFVGSPPGGVSTDDPNRPGNTPTDIPVAVASPANVVMVKRITAINGDRVKNPRDNTPLDIVINNVAPADNSNWPTGYLKGAVEAGKIAPGDTIEYTVYFLNAGGTTASKVRLCDRIQPNQVFQRDIYTAGKGIQLQLGTGSAIDLTNSDDSSSNIDRAQFIDANNTVPTTCNLQGANDNGTVVVDVTGANNTGVPSLTKLDNATAQGSPNSSFGFFRFTTTATGEATNTQTSVVVNN